MSALTLISPKLVLTVIIFLDPKYSTPNTEPLRPSLLFRIKFSGRMPKKFLLPFDSSSCLGISNSAPSIFTKD